MHTPGVTPSLTHSDTMPHRFALALLLLTGCFRNHGTTDEGPADDGGIGRDGGAWTSCREADLGGRTGDPCTFEDACFGDGPCTGTSVRCVGGRLEIERTTDPTCPTSCDELAALEGDPRSRTCAVDFGTCALPTSECCVGTYRCDGGFVVLLGETCDTDCAASDVCASWSPPPPEAIPCTSDGDCDASAGAYCLPPRGDPGCGICSTAERTCASDADCPEGTHCEEYEPACPTCDGTMPTACFEDCVPGGCPAGLECSAGGACVPLRCDTGAIDCPENFRCTGFSDDGCVRLGCESATECDCGSCIGGQCYEGPGTCELPRA